ncbi:unnamed protein product [Ambrosiozyma monospora]|uniref:Unnamed protein product n=1 Tax=Ambrosiozyma monospora TaxID=43982 RepID=A0ACB5T4W1_AMBMO|nr:unnamed protein product [Ambrosiozyma monospora]
MRSLPPPVSRGHNKFGNDFGFVSSDDIHGMGGGLRSGFGSIRRMGSVGRSAAGVFGALGFGAAAASAKSGSAGGGDPNTLSPPSKDDDGLGRRFSEGSYVPVEQHGAHSSDGSGAGGGLRVINPDLNDDSDDEF